MQSAKRTDEDTTPGNGDPFRALMAAILAQAGMDARSGDLGAADWLLGEDARDYAEILDLNWRPMIKKAAKWRARPKGRLVLRICEVKGCNP